VVLPKILLFGKFASKLPPVFGKFIRSLVRMGGRGSFPRSHLHPGLIDLGNIFADRVWVIISGNVFRARNVTTRSIYFDFQISSGYP
jgi:hypothetical protein